MGETKADRRTLIALAVVACVIVLGFVLFGGKSEVPAMDSSTVDSATIVALPAPTTVPQQDTITAPTSFDPNTVDSSALVALGLQPYQAHAWIRYREAGGLFYEPQDIERLYTLSEEDIQRLMPKVKIRAASHVHRNNYHREWNHNRHTADSKRTMTSRTERATINVQKFDKLTKVEVNTADTNLLKRIPGIGSNIARWIVERREKLGGFYTVNQLLEVKHVEPSMLEWFTVDVTQIQPIRLNKMTFAEMSRFPYIGYDKAKAISNYQRIYGPILDEEQLRATHIFTDEELEKLKNYIF